ncbi:heme-molybdoenzyme heme-containing subunit YedZ; cytochrome b subunit [Candidatus Sulfotelmatomonas gaucii]|uniref:Protein-methionine-sulfoxide reductase heme-binding subunit MsrQ n=1 Tax=Candidatus Sulfuritelmatomonas gaucii TaxID=2043161 RepID=A0A2N9L3W8_9BACT|nr:heme-molybdoenzyme heme-containing subunit YedZ; cytochrome b subunit [Candidatus Sulfotelmatomonas gaucii]
MNRSTTVLLKTAVWIACLVPVARLVWGAITNNLGPDPTATIAFSTGLATLRLLTITLAISPVRRLSARLVWLVKFRRLLGLFAFFYATLHMLTYVGLYAGFSLNAMFADVAKRRFITMGVSAYLLLLPLALTSTTWSIRKLGGKNWNRLHRLIYLAAICGVIHYWWQVKTGVLTPITITVIVGVLLLARPVLAFLQRRKSRAVVTA